MITLDLGEKTKRAKLGGDSGLARFLVLRDLEPKYPAGLGFDLTSDDAGSKPRCGQF